MDPTTTISVPTHEKIDWGLVGTWVSVAIALIAGISAGARAWYKHKKGRNCQSGGGAHSNGKSSIQSRMHRLLTFAVHEIDDLETGCRRTNSNLVPVSSGLNNNINQPADNNGHEDQRIMQEPQVPKKA